MAHLWAELLVLKEIFTEKFDPVTSFYICLATAVWQIVLYFNLE